MCRVWELTKEDMQPVKYINPAMWDIMIEKLKINMAQFRDQLPVQTTAIVDLPCTPNACR